MLFDRPAEAAFLIPPHSRSLCSSGSDANLDLNEIIIPWLCFPSSSSPLPVLRSWTTPSAAPRPSGAWRHPCRLRRRPACFRSTRSRYLRTDEIQDADITKYTAAPPPRTAAAPPLPVRRWPLHSKRPRVVGGWVGGLGGGLGWVGGTARSACGVL